MVDLRGLFASQIDKDYYNLSGDAFAKKYPEKAKEIQERQLKHKKARNESNVQFLDGVNEVAKAFTGGNPIYDKIREKAHEFVTSDMRQSLVQEPQNKWQ